MTETKHPGEKLTVTPAKGTLSLKRPGVEQGVVKQSFSHGRTKAVVVEKVKSRRGEGKTEAAPAAAPAANSAASTQLRRPGTAGRGAPAPTAAPSAKAGGGGVVLRRLTEEELARAVRIDPSQIQGLGPSLEALMAILQERKRKILETYETGQVQNEAHNNFHGRAEQMRPPGNLAKPFARAVRDELLFRVVNRLLQPTKLSSLKTARAVSVATGTMRICPGSIPAAASNASR